MQVKIFHIRLTKENLHNDEETLNKFMENVSVKKTATQLINGQPNFWSILVFYDENRKEITPQKTEAKEVVNESELTAEETKIYDYLKQWRKDKALQMNVPSYMVCHNKELVAIAKFKPQNIEELMKIKGFGGQKVSNYGDDILALLNSV